MPGTSLNLNRIGYGAMRLAGPHVWGPPKDVDAAVAVLREAVTLGVNHIDTSGEIGTTGAAAVANAVFNATGKRIRDLPITLDKLL